MAGKPYFILAALLVYTVAGAAVRSQEILDPEGLDAASATVAPDYGADTLAEQADCHYYDDGSIIDVLVLYTTAARLYNSSNDIHAYIQANVDTMNAILRNSLAYPRIRVVHTQEVVYDESDCSNVDCTIDRILNRGDGYLDYVDGLRDAYQADIVLLFVRCVNCGGVAACNRGDQYILDSNNAFAVVASDWGLQSLWGTAHELAHIMGCGHNRDAEHISPGFPINCRSLSYSYGYDFIGESGQWNCTIMSYGPTLCGGIVGGLPCKLWSPICPDCKHLPPPKIPYFSNPDVYFDGRPTGVPVGDPNEANNVLTINVNAFMVANYRQRSGNIWVDFAYSGTEYGCFEHPYNTLSEGVSHVPDDGTLIFKAGSSSETGTINKRITLKAYGGTVRIGG
jgi:hypothetical protein